MTKRKAPLDLGKFADEANVALNYLFNEGYETEVQSIRAFLIAQGENWRKTQITQHKVAASLSHDLMEAKRALRQAGQVKVG